MGRTRVHRALRKKGVCCGRNRVARLMRIEGIQGVHRRMKTNTTIRDEGAAPVPDLVDLKFSADRPDKLWVTEITYVWTYEGWLYVAAVLDVFSRRIVGWAMAGHLRTELVTDALNMALFLRRPQDGLVLHSDRGCQFTSFAFGRRCEEAGIVPSMGSAGDAYDNAMVKASLRRSNASCSIGSVFKTKRGGRTEIFDFIEGFYNPHRLHSSLDYMSAIEFEKEHLAKMRFDSIGKCLENRGNFKSPIDPEVLHTPKNAKSTTGPKYRSQLTVEQIEEID